MQRTFSILKPDAVKNNVTGQINAMIQAAGLRIIAQKMLQITPAQAEKFYAEHQGKDFFPGLVDCMTSGPVVVQVLEGEDAIAKYRKVLGATNPEKAEPGTVRKLFGSGLPFNAAHGSDSPESAAREISFFFAGIEIFS